MNSEDIIYLAAIVDGEGSITIYKHVRNRKKTDYGGFVTVTNTSKALILWLCTTFGGSWCVRKGNELSKKEILRWQVYGKEALLIVAQILPHLKIKCKHAQLFLKFYASITQSKDRQAGLSDTAVIEREYLLNEMHKLTGGENEC